MMQPRFKLAMILAALCLGAIALQGCSSGPVSYVEKAVCLPMRDYTGTTIVQQAAGEISEAQGKGLAMDNQQTLNRDYHVMRNLNKLACASETQKKGTKQR